MTLLDLYILTVFRLCAASRINEDCLIGFGRGSASRLSSSSPVSLTMEADADAPLPRDGKGFWKTQEFVNNSRARLDNIVNLDKFQSSDSEEGLGVASPRAKDEVHNFARRLEKETAAACSCLFAAILIDVANQLFNNSGKRTNQQQPLWADLILNR